MADKEDIEERLVKETGILGGLSEEQRREWVFGVIKGVSEAIGRIQDEKGLIKKQKLAQQVFDEFNKKSNEIVTAFLYAVKPDYLPAMIPLLKAITGVKEKIEGFE